MGVLDPELECSTLVPNFFYVKKSEKTILRYNATYKYHAHGFYDPVLVFHLTMLIKMFIRG